MAQRERPHVGFVIERILGHATHAENLARLLPQQSYIDATVVGIDWDMAGVPARIPGFNSNWTVRAGVRARRAIRTMRRTHPLDALFIHSQVPAVLTQDRMRRIPTVVSLDATPLQYDELGPYYAHTPGHPKVERLKWRANQRCFQRAAHLVTWSKWAKEGLVEGY
jgi:hypothetical protein